MQRGAPVLAAEGIEKRYGRRLALAGVDLAVGPGETVALLGPNGAGKSTLLSVLAGAVAPSRGSVRRPPPAETGWVPQRPALYARLSPRENLRLFARLAGLPDAGAEVGRLLAALELAADADAPAGQLSVGGQQRLNVALGLLGAPRLVFLDEPSASLDPRQRLALWRLLRSLAADGCAVVFATQDVEEAHRHADRLLVLVDGRPAFAGAHAELFARAGLDPEEAPFEQAFVAFLERAAAERVA